MKTIGKFFEYWIEVLELSIKSIHLIVFIGLGIVLSVPYIVGFFGIRDFTFFGVEDVEHSKFIFYSFLTLFLMVIPFKLDKKKSAEYKEQKMKIDDLDSKLKELNQKNQQMPLVITTSESAADSKKHEVIRLINGRLCELKSAANIYISNSKLGSIGYDNEEMDYIRQELMQILQKNSFYFDSAVRQQISNLVSLLTGNAMRFNMTMKESKLPDRDMSKAGNLFDEHFKEQNEIQKQFEAMTLTFSRMLGIKPEKRGFTAADLLGTFPQTDDPNSSVDTKNYWLNPGDF